MKGTVGISHTCVSKKNSFFESPIQRAREQTQAQKKSICDAVQQSRGIEVSASVHLEVSMPPTMTGNFWHTPTQLRLMPKAVGTQIQGVVLENKGVKQAGITTQERWLEVSNVHPEQYAEGKTYYTHRYINRYR